MHAPVKLPQYRIRGLDSLALTKTAKVHVNKAPAAKSTMWDQCVQAVGRPHISDVLWDFRCPELRDGWPTFDFLSLAPRIPSIKHTPLHLTEYLPMTSPRDQLAVEIYQADDRRRIGMAGIRHLLESGEIEEVWSTIKTPLTAAITTYFTSGTRWFQKRKKELLLLILETPEAAFVTIASGKFVSEHGVLSKKAFENPRIAFELFNNPLFTHLAPYADVAPFLGEWPHYHVLASAKHDSITESNEQFLNRISAESSSPIAAAFALALRPQDGESPKWLESTRMSPEACFWAGKIWQAAGNEVSEFPFYMELNASIQSDPKWYFHWARDLEPSRASEIASQLWPSPWAVELIQDLDLSQNLVTDLYSKTLSGCDQNDFWNSTLILWAADYIKTL